MSEGTFYLQEGKIRGFAIVEYAHPVFAVQAISMFNGQIVSVLLLLASHRFNFF